MNSGEAVEAGVPMRARLPLERELRMIGEAVDLVATGIARRVTIANLHLGEHLLDEARQLADQAGLVIVAMASAGTGADIAVERPDPDVAEPA